MELDDILFPPLSGVLVQGFQEFHSEQVDTLYRVMTAYTCLDGWRLGRQPSRSGGGGWRRNRQVQELIHANCPRARKKCSSCTDIQRFRQIEKFHSGGVCAPDEHWNLHVNPLRTPALSGG